MERKNQRSHQKNFKRSISIEPPPMGQSFSGGWNPQRLGVFVVISDEAGGIADIGDVWRWGEDERPTKDVGVAHDLQAKSR